MVIKQIGHKVIQRRLAKGESALDITISMYEQAAVMLANGQSVDREWLTSDPICGTGRVPYCQDGCVLSIDGGPSAVCDLMNSVYDHDAKRPGEIHEVVRALKQLQTEVNKDETL